MAEKQHNNIESQSVWDHYRRMAEAVGDIIYTADTRGLITYVSAAVQQLTGFSADEMRGRTFTDFFPPTWESTVRVAYEGQPIKLPLVTRSGKECWVEQVVIYTEDGVQGMMRDVTEREQTMAALIEERNLLRSLMNSFPHSIYFKDTASRFIKINPTQAQVLGVAKAEEVLGKTDADYFPAMADAMLAQEQQIMSSGQPMVDWLEYNPTTEGEKRWFSVTKAPLRAEDGQVIGTVGISHNITERYKNEMRYRALFEQTNNAIFMFDLNGVYIDANQQAADMLGCTLNEIIESSIDKFIAPQEVARARDVINTLLSGRDVPAYERMMVRKDGEQFPVEVIASVVYDEGRRPLHIQQIARDITARKHADREMKQVIAQVEALYTVSQALISAKDFEEMLRSFMMIAVDPADPSAETPNAGLYYVYEDENGRSESIQRVSAITAPQVITDPVGMHYLIAESPIWRLMQSNHNQIISIADIDADDPLVNEEVREAVRDWGFQSITFIPLVSQRGNWIGAVTLSWTKPHEFSFYQYQIYNAAAPQLAALVENRRLFDRARTALQELSASEELLRTVVTNAPVVLFALDKDQQITLLEGNVFTTLDVTPEMIIGQNAKRALKGETFTATVNLGEVTFETRYSPMRDAEGEINGVIGVATDVTERRRFEIELDKRVNQLTALQQVEQEMSDRLNTEHVMTMALDAVVRLSGADTGFIGLLEDERLRIAESVGDYTRTPFIDPQKGIIGRVMRHQEEEMVMDVQADADYVAILPKTKAQIVIPLMNDEKVIGVLNLETSKPERFSIDTLEFAQLLASRIAVAIDNAHLYQISQDQLAELRTLYGKVKKLEQLKTDMIRIASHDLRNPLATIVGYLELLRWDKDALTPDHRDYLDNIQRASERMQKITSDILSLERIEESANEEYTEIVDLQDLTTKVMPDVLDQAKRRGQTLTFNSSAMPVNVVGDSVQLNEAIVNLINNAIKYTPEGGLVKVDLRAIEGSAIFTVEDTGYGVPEDQHSKLFEPFSRVRTKETKRIEGTGLGLYLVKNIIERHKGTMMFRSVYGEGSMFGFNIPAAE